MLLASVQAGAEGGELTGALAKRLADGKQHTSFNGLDRLLKGVHTAVGHVCELCAELLGEK